MHMRAAACVQTDGNASKAPTQEATMRVGFCPHDSAVLPASGDAEA